MHLFDLVRRQNPPHPWTEGDNIPWNDPAFSQRMLKEHLSQQHDAASRRFAIIDGHVGWIDQHLLEGRPSRVLDLACGPGLYTARLARLGHVCTGIDFSPASVEYANAAAVPGTAHVLGDVRTTPFGEGYDLVMMLFGEFNVFRPDAAADLLRRARAALRPGGRLLLEPATFAHTKAMGEAHAAWAALESGLFSERPHLYLEEAFWDTASCTATTRYWAVDAATGGVERWASSYAAYTDAEFQRMVTEAGFRTVTLLEGLGGAPRQPGLMAILAEA